MSKNLSLLTVLLVASLGSTPATSETLADGANSESESRQPLYLLPPGFSGWICIDFGVADAPPLPREGGRVIIRPAPDQVLKTSDTRTWWTEDVRIELKDRREAPAAEETLRETTSLWDSNSPVSRHCSFFGTIDAADAAGSPPGFEDEHLGKRISEEDRKVLIALYEATSGSRWKHKVGWLGPPGTECTWHGVRCDITPDPTTSVVDLDLSENGLVGRISELQEGLPHLKWCALWGNRISGQLPQWMIRGWLSGQLALWVEEPLLTDVSEIDFESASSGSRCARHRIVLRSDLSITLFTERCRDKPIDELEVYCEVKQGQVPGGEFARLAAFLERSGFYRLAPKYSRAVTHGGFEDTRVKRAGKTYVVSNYASSGPAELWAIQRAIEGVASSAEWEKTYTMSECPRQR